MHIRERNRSHPFEGSLECRVCFAGKSRDEVRSKTNARNPSSNFFKFVGAGFGSVISPHSGENLIIPALYRNVEMSAYVCPSFSRIFIRASRNRSDEFTRQFTRFDRRKAKAPESPYLEQPPDEPAQGSSLFEIASIRAEVYARQDDFDVPVTHESSGLGCARFRVERAAGSSGESRRAEAAREIASVLDFQQRAGAALKMRQREGLKSSAIFHRRDAHLGRPGLPPIPPDRQVQMIWKMDFLRISQKQIRLGNEHSIRIGLGRAAGQDDPAPFRRETSRPPGKPP